MSKAALCCDSVNLRRRPVEEAEAEAEAEEEEDDDDELPLPLPALRRAWTPMAIWRACLRMGLDCFASPTELTRDRRELSPPAAFRTEEREAPAPWPPRPPRPPPEAEESTTSGGSGLTRFGFFGTGPLRLTALGLKRELRAFFWAAAETSAAAAAASPLLVERARAPARISEDEVFCWRGLPVPLLPSGSGLAAPEEDDDAAPAAADDDDDDDALLRPRRLPLPREPDRRARETEAPMAELDGGMRGMILYGLPGYGVTAIGDGPFVWVFLTPSSRNVIHSMLMRRR